MFWLATAESFADRGGSKPFQRGLALCSNREHTDRDDFSVGIFFIEIYICLATACL